MINLKMPILEILRREHNFSYGTLGVLSINKQIFCCTLEPPDFLNKPFLSCIPTGQYSCIKFQSDKFGWTYKVLNVPDRDNVLFHAGNTKKDTEGCIILGESFGKLANQDRTIINSGTTFNNFKYELRDYDNLNLTIEEHY